MMKIAVKIVSMSNLIHYHRQQSDCIEQMMGIVINNDVSKLKAILQLIRQKSISV